MRNSDGKFAMKTISSSHLMRRSEGLFTLLRDRPMRKRITETNPKFTGTWFVYSEQIMAEARYGLTVI